MIAPFLCLAFEVPQAAPPYLVQVRGAGGWPESPRHSGAVVCSVLDLPGDVIYALCPLCVAEEGGRDSPLFLCVNPRTVLTLVCFTSYFYPHGPKCGKCC